MSKTTGFPGRNTLSPQRGGWQGGSKMQNSRGKRTSKRSQAVYFERILVQIARVQAHLSQNRVSPSAIVTKKDHFPQRRLPKVGTAAISSAVPDRDWTGRMHLLLVIRGYGIDYPGGDNDERRGPAGLRLRPHALGDHGSTIRHSHFGGQGRVLEGRGAGFISGLGRLDLGVFQIEVHRHRIARTDARGQPYGRPNRLIVDSTAAPAHRRQTRRPRGPRNSQWACSHQLWRQWVDLPGP